MAKFIKLADFQSDRVAIRLPEARCQVFDEYGQRTPSTIQEQLAVNEKINSIIHSIGIRTLRIQNSKEEEILVVPSGKTNTNETITITNANVISKTKAIQLDTDNEEAPKNISWPNATADIDLQKIASKLKNLTPEEWSKALNIEIRKTIARTAIENLLSTGKYEINKIIDNTITTIILGAGIRLTLDLHNQNINLDAIITYLILILILNNQIIPLHKATVNQKPFRFSPLISLAGIEPLRLTFSLATIYTTTFVTPYQSEIK